LFLAENKVIFYATARQSLRHELRNLIGREGVVGLTKSTMRLTFESKIKRGIREEHGAVGVEFVGQPPRSIPGKLDRSGRLIGNV
jgi:hypothetical protein